MRICVTGAAGYIGGWLLAELHNRGHEVHAQDLVHPNADEQVWTSFREFDLGIETVRQAWLRQHHPGVVIHLAALYGRVWGEIDKVKTASANAGLTAALAADCNDIGARMMFMSSSEVYGRSADRGPVAEWADLYPMNMYGLSKKWGEEACAVYCGQGLMVTRLNMPYGPAYWPPHKGEIPHISGKPGSVGYNVLHSMLWEATFDMPLLVHSGTSRCLTWVGDTCRGLRMILESGQSGVWNVNRSDDTVMISDLAKRVVALTGSRSEIRIVDRPERLTMQKLIRSEKLSGLGWEPEVGLDAGMRWTWEYYRKFGRDGRWRG